jgi:FkbH-like protein
MLRGVDHKRRLLGAAAWHRDRTLTKLGKKGVAYDAFAVECYSFEQEPCRLIVEVRKSSITVFRTGLEIKPGLNSFSLSVPLPPVFSRDDDYLMMLYPEGDKEIRVVFTWLDFILHRQRQTADAVAAGGGRARPAYNAPAAKVKCVAWDLDNTLWNGILIEGGERGLQIRPQAEKLVRWFNERGIIQTVVSKNNYEDAMAVLAKHGLEEFFVYPAINWDPKSSNLKQIADHLNIDIDTFALIDDSEFERHEVEAALPMVRVYKEDALAELPGYPEFDVPVTEASRIRLKSYRAEMQREKAKEVSGASWLEFLRSCHLKLRVFPPRTKLEIDRCHELIQRSNQLNLSTRRYDKEQFEALVAGSDVFTVAMECEDRFGTYGIVGFASIEFQGDSPVARDFVLSCRVAQKRVEHAFYGWLGNYMKQRGANTLFVHLIKTARNSPLLKVFEEMPFETVNSEAGAILLAMDLSGPMISGNIVEVDDSAFARGGAGEDHHQL